MNRFFTCCDRHAIWIVVLAMVMAMALWLTGCGQVSSPTLVMPGSSPIERPDPLAVQLAALQTRLTEAEEDRDTAVKSGNALDRLSAEKDILATRTQLAEAQAVGLQREATELRAQTRAKVEEIATERTHEKQVWLVWFSGSIGLAGLIAVGIGFGWPLVRRIAWTIAACCGAISALALVVAAILPWLWWIGAALLLGFIGWVLYHWHRDHHGLVQVVTAVEQLKPAEAQARQIFKDGLSKVIDSPIATRIAAIKARYRIGPQA